MFSYIFYALRAAATSFPNLLEQESKNQTTTNYGKYRLQNELIQLEKAIKADQEHDWTQYHYFYPSLMDDKENAAKRFDEPIIKSINNIKNMCDNKEITIEDFTVPYQATNDFVSKNVNALEVLWSIRNANSHVRDFIKNHLIPNIKANDSIKNIYQALSSEHELFSFMINSAPFCEKKITAQLIELDKIGVDLMELNYHGINIFIAILHKVVYEISFSDLAARINTATKLLSFLSKNGYIKLSDLDKKYLYYNYGNYHLDAMKTLKGFFKDYPQTLIDLLVCGLSKVENNYQFSMHPQILNELAINIDNENIKQAVYKLDKSSLNNLIKCFCEQYDHEPSAKIWDFLNEITDFLNKQDSSNLEHDKSSVFNLDLWLKEKSSVKLKMCQ